MATRLEIARAIGLGSAGLFKPDGPDLNGLGKHWTSKPRLSDLTNVLRRPVEVTG
jgi:hypothetical protein